MFKILGKIFENLEIGPTSDLLLVNSRLALIHYWFCFSYFGFSRHFKVNTTFDLVILSYLLTLLIVFL